MIASSDLFDREWYLKEYPDIRKAGTDPALHYVLHGAAEGRDPGPLFDGEWYLYQNPDARQVRANPLLHYLRNRPVKGSHPKEPDDPSLQLSAGVRRTVPWHGLHGLRKQLPRESFTKNLQPTVSEHAAENSSALNIVFINHDSFHNNSAGHIIGFANALAERGHNVIVSAKGSPERVAEYGIPQFRCVSRAMLTAEPETLRHILGDAFDDAPTLIHCWTPRENTRLATTALVARLSCPYVVHLDDNEEFVTRSLLGITADQASRMSFSDWDDRVPSVLSHPFHARTFVSGAAGITIIVDALRALIPGNLAVHLLEPGVDATLLSPRLDPDERSKLCRELGVPSDARIIAYTGNIHLANAAEMLALYEAVHLLNRNGNKVHLIRTGLDRHTGTDDELNRFSAQHVTHLGFVDRRRLVEVLRLADAFVQPGAADKFNEFRLPSKLPEFLASGRPVILPATNLGLRLRDGIDALLLRCGDATEIAGRLIDVLWDNDLADRLGRNGRRFAVENFNWRRSALELEKFYRAMLSCRARPHAMSDLDPRD